MEYQTRSPQATARNARRTRYWWKYRNAYDVINELTRRGVTDFPARFKGMSEDEYKSGLIDVLIDNDYETEQRIA